MEKDQAVAGEQEMQNFKEIFNNPVFWVLLIPVSINLWKLFYLNYSFAEFLGNLGLDTLLFGIVLTAVAMNPIQYPVVYRGVFAVFVISYLAANTPVTFWEWFGVIVVFFLLFCILPYLKELTLIIFFGIIVAYMIIRVVLPLEYKSQAAKDLSLKSPGYTARKFMEHLSSQSIFTLGAERFRFYMDTKKGISPYSLKISRLHRSINKNCKQKHINWILWDIVSINSTKVDDETYNIKLYGQSRATLTDNKYITQDMITYTDPLFPNSPIIIIHVQPITLKLKKQKDGEFKVVDVQDSLTFDFAGKTDIGK